MHILEFFYSLLNHRDCLEMFLLNNIIHNFLMIVLNKDYHPLLYGLCYLLRFSYENNVSYYLTKLILVLRYLRFFLLFLYNPYRVQRILNCLMSNHIGLCVDLLCNSLSLNILHYVGLQIQSQQFFLHYLPQHIYLLNS